MTFMDESYDYAAQDLLVARLCTAHCLCAYVAGEKCDCICEGKYHGLLATAPVSGTSHLDIDFVWPAQISLA